MAGKQAKLLSACDIKRMLRHVKRHRYPERDRVIVLLSVKAGLRAGEIAHLTWPMLLDPQGRVGEVIELHDRAAKKRGGRVIPMHPMLRRALSRLLRQTTATGVPLEGPVICSERYSDLGAPLQPGSIVYWFARFYRELGLRGCSSHSGRRTFVTAAARLVHRAGGSLCDVQQLVGHRSIEQTQTYIEGDTRAKRRLVALL